MDSLKVVLLALFLAFSSDGTNAGPLNPSDVPEPLQPWIQWVMHGDEQRLCPFIYNDINQRRCAWPSTLKIHLQDQAGQFQATWQVYAPSWVLLPGNTKHWPQEVTIDGRVAVVVSRGNRPAIELAAGEYLIEGRFDWDRLPEAFAIPPESGLVEIFVSGSRIAFPDISDNGQVWLKQRDAESDREGNKNSMTVQVFRRITDEVPMQILTRVDLEVGGEPREVLFDGVLLSDFIPINVNSGIPARLEPDGRLRVQVRPGRWSIEVQARSSQSIDTLIAPQVEAQWAESEIWVFDARNHLRLVEIDGVRTVDPRQTNLPEAWRQLPAFELTVGDTMVFDTIRRGDPEPEPDKLNLQRNLWLDFDGDAYTINDVISGSMTHGWRLEAGTDLQLGRVLLDGEPQFITQQQGRPKRGVEVRRGAVKLSADSRWLGEIGELPAVGWDHDVQSLSASLNLPPGWRLFSASGVDQVRTTWVQRWTLLDLFLVLIVAAAVGRLWGVGGGLLAAATLVLIWHEPGSPKTIWLHVLGAIALLSVLPAGKMKLFVQTYRNASLVVLAVIVVPFLVAQIRVGFFPQLEKPWQSMSKVRGVARDVAVQAAAPVAPQLVEQDMVLAEAYEDESVAMTDRSAGSMPGNTFAKSRIRAKKSSGGNIAQRQYKLAKVDPLANVQTGPGVPRWQWNSVELRWNGPVERNQNMSFVLLSPRVNLLLNLLRVGLLVWLAVFLLRGINGRDSSTGPTTEPKNGAKAVPTAQAALFILALMSGACLFYPQNAQADFPPAQMLEQLKQRLTESPSCLPVCAQIPRLNIQVESSLLVVRMEVEAAEDVAIPLPAHAKHWFPETVAVNGELSKGLFRTKRNELWLEVNQGRHQVSFSGPLPSRKSFDLPLPLRPRYVTIEAQGWTVDGVREDGQAGKQLQFTRIENAASPTMNAVELEPAPLLPFVRVERTLRLGLDWRVQTTVTRLSATGSAVVIAVPLLDGESVTTSEIYVVDNAVQVNMSAQERTKSWESSLEKSASIALSAPATTAWTEIWRADVSPIWHAEPSGLAVVHHQNSSGKWLPEWRPWPGEQVSIALTRPVGVEGQTLTIDQSNLTLRPGKRATDVDLTTNLRSSQGGQHTLMLPVDARLQSVRIDGVSQPIRQEARAVTLPLHPGNQAVTLNWRQPQGMSWHLHTPVVDLGAPSVNANITMNLSNGDRWVLLTRGPTLGPAVLFWGILTAIVLVAVALGRVKLTPLNSISWVLLAIGLSQVYIWLALVVVIWLFACGIRERYNDKTHKVIFDLTQIALVLLTLASLSIMFHAIQQGLLGHPDMQIAGNGSNATNLQWYQDRADAVLPQASVISVPLMAYRLLMLAWALWLAFALLRWLRWAWTCFATDGLWRPLRKPKQKADSGLPS